MNLIINFDDFDGPNPHAFLSNFYQGKPIKVFSRKWATGEHAFAGMKTTDLGVRGKIRGAPTPGYAKAMGRKVALREDWEEIKYDVMMTILRAKFTRERREGELLLNTGDALLVEGTAWSDAVWGVKGHKVTSPGRNWLGTMLMARRAELQAPYDGYLPDLSAEDWIMRKETSLVR